ncbi:MAG: vWA domain-containing protein [Sedimentibacter saalensis]|uniref:vWA domain-containing protein n=1 Tax=Sedimentibacter saalensis TaxID=130788 RepID=UPI002B1EAC99|nr:vWA domain-containing protein [Sedimentibacter saalensis]MEA5093869.1 vWA domain-containing protein [Sedimentibacter saalensis]
MKNNLTEMVFILDKSGSMSGLEQDTIGGFNSMLKRQKKEEGEALVTTVLFDNNYELLHERLNIQNVNFLSQEEYFVGGSTALLDAIGRTISRISKSISESSEQFRPGKVIFVIITDGMENSSKEFTFRKIKDMIELKKSKYAWYFIFLGANINAAETALNLGIDEERAANFCPDSEGTMLNYKVVSEAVSNFRKGKKVEADWKSEIETDYNKRGRK